MGRLAPSPNLVHDRTVVFNIGNASGEKNIHPLSPFQKYKICSRVYYADLTIGFIRVGKTARSREKVYVANWLDYITINVITYWYH